ncbi:MAG TPA: cellulase family glycosylhydrolase [Bacteroidia bacterium]|jgi:hypothetical protein|nr:cellulase family glycosylhydrolase [Bacteroidia bacterium]
MKKTVLLVFLVFIGVNAFAGNFIRRDGAVLFDSTGKQAKLNGVNLGGWLLWEGWIWGGSFTKESKILSNMQTLVGEAETDSFRLNIYRNFISENDIKQVSEMGLNVVRVPFNHRIFDPIGGKVYGWEILDNVIAWCKKYHVYVVLDMHAAPGGNSPYFTADPDKPNLWKDPQAKNKTIELWKQIAARYANETTVAGYDLLNEPIPTKGDSLEKMYERIIAQIRTVDTNHLVILEGGNFAKDFSMFQKLPDEKMMFSFHIYTWLGGEPGDKMTDFTELGKRMKIPVWCGEWGENKYDVVKSTLLALNDKANNFSGWCFWTWKKVLNSYPALNQVTVTQSWIDLIKWCANGSVKSSPGHDPALAAMKEFESDMLIANTKRDERLAELLKDYASW